jgi:hypothetical protein
MRVIDLPVARELQTTLVNLAKKKSYRQPFLAAPTTAVVN